MLRLGLIVGALVNAACALYVLRLVAALVCAAVFFGTFTVLIAVTVEQVTTIHHKYTDDHWEEHANQTLHSIMRRLDEWHVLNHTHGLPNAGDEVQELLSYAESLVFRVEGFGSSL